MSKPLFGYKLTTDSMQTHGGFLWELGVERTADGHGPLCGSGWLHYYTDPLLALLLNPIHADFDKPRLFRAKVGPVQQHDRGLKAGTTSLTLVEEMPRPAITLGQRVNFAKLCAEWAKIAAAGPWLSSEEISVNLARLAREAVAQ